MKMSLFDWLKEITSKKSDWDSFEDKDKETFNPYMIHRFLSMNEDYVELVNYIQTIPYTEKGKNGISTCQLEHSDGNPLNNKLDNLLILCPNCHSLTEFYGARGKGCDERRNRFPNVS